MPHLLSMNSYHYRRGGADAVYLDHAEMFEHAGWTNSFFSMQHPRNLDCKDSKHFAKLVDIEYVDGPVSKLKSAVRSVYNFDARNRIKQLISERRPDIAHAHGIYHHLTPAILPVVAAAGIPIVLTAHDLKLACPAYKMMNSKGICEACIGGANWHVVTNRCIKNSLAASAVVGVEAYLHTFLGSYKKHLSRIVAPSRFYQAKLIEWGWEPERIRYIPNFVPSIDSRFEGGYIGNILYFGRLAPEKGLSTLVRAAAISGVSVDIAGTGPEYDALVALIAREQAPVRMLGRLDGDTLWSTVGNARAVVLPSEWYENAPMSTLEAMQLGRPVIGAEIGGIPELISESGAGITCLSGSVGELAAALTHIMALSTPRLAEMGRAGAEFVAREFSRDLYIRRMNALYNEILK